MKRLTVAIIGGGFCGTLAAIRLLTAGKRGDASLPFGSRIVLIEPTRPGQGLAYRAGPDYWRLNVPAARMSAFAGRPADFFEWAQARDPQVQAADYLPRAWYGEYLADRLALAKQRSPRWLEFEHVRTRATGLSVDDGLATIRLSNGAVIEADRVLLALGNSPTAAPVPDAPDAVADAWNLDWMESLPTYVPRVLLVGTGLTMIDIALAIAEQRPDARVLAISRHGLLPRSHEDAPGKPAAFDAQKFLARGPLSQRLRQFRAQVASSAGRYDWRAALQSVREVMPELWRASTPRTRQRFLRHLRAWWDVHRHRVPQGTLSRIEELRQRNRLAIESGRIVETHRIKDGTVVSWRPRGSSKLRQELVDVVVNVTGPDSNPVRSDCPLVQSLLSEELCRPDNLRLGWETDASGRLVAADGQASKVLYYVGPLLRARDWEATAVPELRTHVDRTAAAIAASLATSAGSYLRKLAAPVFRREQPVF
jgi:uncharacterized NAD(P)/FAD-binding protein YdhS